MPFKIHKKLKKYKTKENIKEEDIEIIYDLYYLTSCIEWSKQAPFSLSALVTIAAGFIISFFTKIPDPINLPLYMLVYITGMLLIVYILSLVLLKIIYFDILKKKAIEELKKKVILFPQKFSEILNIIKEIDIETYNYLKNITGDVLNSTANTGN